MDNNNNNNNNKPKMPKFNVTWIYILFGIGLLVFYFSSGEGSPDGVGRDATYADFKTWVDKGWATEIVANTDEKTLKMYVAPEHIRDVFHADTKQVGTKPYLNVEFGSVDKLEEFLDNARSSGKFTGKFFISDTSCTVCSKKSSHNNVTPLSLIVGALPQTPQGLLALDLGRD